MELRAAPAGPLFFSIDVGTHQTVVWVSGGPSSTLHHENLSEGELPRVDIPDAFSADVVLLLAGRMALLPGLTADAARLAASAIDGSLSVLIPEMLEHTLDLLLSGGRLDDAFRLGMLASADDRAATVAQLMLMRFARGADGGSRAAIASGLASWSSEAEADGDAIEAGRLAHNTAQLLRGDDRKRALALLSRAGNLDPGYRTRGYWWREQGGLLFLMAQYEESGEAYRHAVSLGERSAVPLLADALLWSSQFAEAIALFEEVGADGSLSEPEWRLKALAYRDLVERGFHDETLLDADALHAAVHDEATPEEARLTLAVARPPWSALIFRTCGSMRWRSRWAATISRASRSRVAGSVGIRSSIYCWNRTWTLHRPWLCRHSSRGSLRSRRRRTCCV